MPKLKTNKSAQKRVKKTANGKVKMAHSARNHRRAHKSSRQNKQDRKSKLLVISSAMKKAFAKLLPKS